MNESIVAMLDIGKTLIPCVGVLGIVHAQDMYDHSIGDLSLAIYLGVEGRGFGEIGVQQWLEARPECAEKSTVPIWDNGLWDSKMYPVFNVDLLRPYFPPLLNTLDVAEQLTPIELNPDYI